MKNFIRTHRKDLVILVAFFVFVLISHFFEILIARQIFHKFLGFLEEMLLIIPAMFILIGLFDVWVHREKIERHIGHDSGVKGIFWVTLLAMLQAGPLYGAFPVAYMLQKKGASLKNIFIYIGAFSSMKIPMLSFEIGFLGLKFSLLRTLLTLDRKSVV